MSKAIHRLSFLSFIVTSGICAATVVSFGQQSRIKTIAGAKLFTIDKFVPTATDQKIYFLVSVDPDCSPQTPPTIRIVSKPQHGVINISDAEDYGAWQAPNIREKCNDKKTKGIKVSYKSDDGYTGDDEASILAIFSESSGQQFVFNIHVW
jgi:hypothetical protein